MSNSRKYPWFKDGKMRELVRCETRLQAWTLGHEISIAIKNPAFDKNH